MPLKRLKGFFLSGFFIANAIALTGTAAFMFLSYLYHFAMVRLLSTSLYGELSVLVGIISILTLPGQTLQTVMAREVSKLDSKKLFPQGYAVARHYLKQVFRAGGLAAVAVILLLQAATLFIKSDFIFYLQLIALFIPVWYSLSLVRGFLQGKEMILALSTIIAFEPFLKLLLAIGFVWAGLGLFGAVVPIELSALILLIPFAHFLFTRHRKTKPVEVHFSSSVFSVLAATFLFTVFLYLDLFAVNLMLGSEQAGYYNVAGITARILFFVANGLALVFLPKSSKLSFSDRKELGRLFSKTLLFLVPGFLVFVLFPFQFISLFYTVKYLSAVVPFIILSVGMFLYAVFQLECNLFWSQHEERLPLALSIAVIPIDLLLLFLLVPRFGLAGAAGATALSSALLFLCGTAGLVARISGFRKAA